MAGLALIACMYLFESIIGITPLPALLSQPLLMIMPGFVFGFLIDTLQHTGKVVEEVGLVLAMVAGLAALGSLQAWVRTKLEFPHVGLAAGLAGWLLVAFILLPLGGIGPLGLNDGLATPVTWALLFAIYGVVLDLPMAPPAASDAGPGRRRLLSLVPLAVGGSFLVLIGALRAPAWWSAVFRPPEAGLAGSISPELTPVENFYVVSKNFVDPAVSGSGWALTVDGLVTKKLTISLDNLRTLPGHSQYQTLECISNLIGGELMSTGNFTGVSLAELIAMASPRAGADYVAFRARDGYTESLPLSLVMGEPDILVAYDLDGLPLPQRHGFPARILIPGHYGMKGPKWLDQISIVSGESQGFWEQQGWDHQAVVKTTARFDVPREGQSVKRGDLPLGGVAYAGSRGVSAVEFSVDGGSTWGQAAVKPPLSNLAWAVWRATWTPAAAGPHTLQVRATDGDGQLQTARREPSYPAGATGYHTIHIDVG